MGWVMCIEVTEAIMVPDPSRTIREKAIASWPPAWHGQNLRDILVTLGYDVDRPWKDLPKKDRDWILFTEETPTVPVYAGFTPAETRAALKRKSEPSYMGTFTGARRYVLHTFATTQSALMRKRVSRFMEGRLCPDVPRQAAQARGAVGDLCRRRYRRVLAHATGPRRRPAAARRQRTFRCPRRRRHRRVRPRRSAIGPKRAAAEQATHAAAPDVRRTPALSEEKRLAAQRLAEGVMARVRTLLAWGWVT